MAGLGSFALIFCAALLPSTVDDATEIIAGWQESRAGQERAELVQRDLGSCSNDVLPALQASAYDFFLKEMEGYRGQSGERMASAMHARASATWSMICLSASQLRMGQAVQALETVRKHLERIEAVAPMEEVRAVWDRMALVARGAGMHELMLDALGQSLAMGSEDALQILGWDSLVDQDHDGAVRLFGALLDRAEVAGKEPAPWALPGWGLALLDGQAQ
ncbi:MAG: hypothetical protein ACI9X4_000814 [Glaciecola sp.]|jgi:hypothetical protein